jgi:hypothetical protein
MSTIKQMPDLLTQLNDQKRKVDFDSYDITVKELVGMVGDNMRDDRHCSRVPTPLPMGR